MVYAYHIKKAMIFFSIHIDTIDNDTETLIWRPDTTDI